MQTFRQILDAYRNASPDERSKGTQFEQLVLVYFKNDAIQTSYYEDVWTYADWAEAQGLDKKDLGIDLVAKIAGSDKFCAIQCKFYDENRRIDRKDLDSFFAASGTSHFGRRIVVDTTGGNWGKNAEALLQDQVIETLRIGLTDLEDSNINWSSFVRDQRVQLNEKKTLRPHQKQALDAVRAGLEEADRGKLIMACGTGKTFTGLKIAEELAGVGKRVLFMVPSLSLMSQTVREWTNDAGLPLKSFAVCSDSQVGKRTGDDDAADIGAFDLAYPSTTNAEKLAHGVREYANQDCMTVVFATYHSIDVITRAQSLHNMEDFDLIICDEAHRTTGAIFPDQDESNFVKVHDQSNVRGHKRLYMTATPRVYGEGVKEKANDASVELCDMDDENRYGKTLFTRGFSWAVENNLLTDYKVIVLAVDEGSVSEGLQKSWQEGSELNLDDATKVIGCYKALNKTGLSEDLMTDTGPMRRAIAFCKNIKTSKLVTKQFGTVANDYLDSQIGTMDDQEETRLRCELEHVDGTYNAKSREKLLSWLKEDTEDSCRILSNAKCLSEGVDVPALDAILFLHPRKSPIDVVQSVGRVMRKAEGKKMGYVILPIAIPPNTSPEDALKDNDRYQVVWQILNALRSHDERMDSTINRIGLGETVNDKIEVIAVSDHLPNQTTPKAEKTGIGGGSENDGESEPTLTKETEDSQQYNLWVDEFAAGIMAKIVKKCGRRDYWEDWAKDIAEIARKHILRINTIVDSGETSIKMAFDAFVAELRDDLNPEISNDDAVEMLAQHIITKPVFDALFEGNEFTAKNPVSRAMTQVVDVLNEHSLENESESLQKFYESVRRRSLGLKTAEARQKLVVELYDKFFRTAFPAMTQKLGIVYTPVEVVDFIIHSVNDVLQSEFGQTLGSKGVHILDPFTGTGTFITRLLQSGLIKPEELEHKYKHEIHANEIVLLAYYIAAINIEAVYHGMAKKHAIALGESGEDMPYTPFDGIVLTDTFQLHEQEKDMIANLLPDNSERRTAQKERDIRVIVGNPPYSAGQKSANDNAANITYPNLDTAIRDSYAAQSTATNKNALYDSYIRAIRWATDRIVNTGEDRGVVAYVSNAGWVDGNTMDGMRKCLAEEFSSLYVFHLRGNARTSGEQRRKERGNVFGEGTRTPIAISVLVRNPEADEFGNIYFHDIGDYLDQKEKLALVRSYKSIKGLGIAKGWKQIEPDENFDWVGQGEKVFESFIQIGSKGNTGKATVFSNYTRGIETGREFWIYNSSSNKVARNMEEMARFYNSEEQRFKASGSNAGASSFVSNDIQKVKWTSSLISRLERGEKAEFEPDKLVISGYRPFFKQTLFYSDFFIHRIGKWPIIFPTTEVENRVIITPGIGGGGDFSPLMSNVVFSLQPNHGTQCFPLKLYEPASADDGLFAAQNTEGETGYTERDGISDAGLKHFQDAYPGEQIGKEDLFYYVYGLLHSPDYREKFKNNLSKELPRIPAVKTAADFWAFSKAGRLLGDLHVNYESVEPYPVQIAQGDLRLANIDDPRTFYRVEKMKHSKKRVDGKNVDDLSSVVYNNNITMTGIPEEAYDYVVNGKPALKWVMERQCVKTDKASGIVNDANDYANETVGNPAYPLELFQRVITVSLETMKIVNALPKLELPD